jgi:hypothetical protein
VAKDIVIRIRCVSPNVSQQTLQANIAMVAEKHLPRLRRFFGDRYIVSVLAVDAEPEVEA